MIRKIKRALQQTPVFEYGIKVYFQDLSDYILGRREPMTPPRSFNYIGGGDFKDVRLSFSEPF